MFAEEVLNKCVLNVCKAGSELLVAGYCLYSSSTVLVLTVGELLGLHGPTCMLRGSSVAFRGMGTRAQHSAGSLHQRARNATTAPLPPPIM